MNVNKFLDDFQDYLKTRKIDQESIAAFKTSYMEVDADPALAKKLQTTDDGSLVRFSSYD